MQVKGKQMKKGLGFPEKFKFSLAKEHYKNYYNEGGVLLIVVGIIYDPDTKRYQKKLYVDSILRLKAKKLMDSISSTQATISTTVYGIEDKELERVCFDFFNNFDRQPRMIEIDKTSIPREGLLTETYISRKQKFLSKEFYISEGQESIFNGYITPESFKKGVAGELINVGDDEFRLNLSWEGYRKPRGGGTVEEYKLVIEDVVEFSLSETKKFTIKKMNYKSLEYQLRVLPFLKKLFEKKKINIPNLIDVTFKELKINSIELEQLENTINLMDEIKEVFDEYHIRTDVKIEGNYSQIVDDIYLLRDVFINKRDENLEGFDNKFSRMVKMNIHDLSFITFYNKETNSFEYPFNDRLVNQSILISEEDSTGTKIREEEFPSIYIALTDFSNICNINYNAILKSFDKKNKIGEMGHGAIVSFILKRIGEYDNFNNLEILKLCTELCKMFGNNSDVSEKNRFIYKINYYQCVRRIRPLETSEIYELATLNIPQKKDEKKLAEFCINVIIGKFEEAEKMLGDISNIEEYPIFSLYKKLLESN
ncbi:hypothetical protein LZ578_02065 [Jeotgalibaca sp. MA1X17-3]|uniref:hypothetical protein n=1 Tax=Jeotgalibaca sp. MA1X17-3 TaxID=2908211 RepID=UPI001F46080D|nr:hypothetical protein [Jeotgalibaca sp. MA1X17-3]UJF15953.1 hypothetical protein LZ578_02065 [Jeotgalibaca sp. MA1X17-3]